MIGLSDVQDAAERINDVVVRTPVLRSAVLDERTGASCFVKVESLQRGGAFKLRGALNAIRSLSDDERARGVIAASSGNHAQAVALATSLCGTSAVVLMPRDAPWIKREGTLRYGADVVLFDRTATDREALLQKRADETGRVVVHPFDDERVMAGQGTVANELVDEVQQLDHLVVPIGGGGLIAGCATVMSARLPAAATWGVEPEAGDDTRRSLRAGERIQIPVPDTIADGQQLVSPGVRPFAVIQQRVHDVVTVSDAEIVESMRFVFDHLKLIAEPSGACALAGLLSGRIDVAGSRVGVVVSGGNVDRDRYLRLLEDGG